MKTLRAALWSLILGFALAELAARVWLAHFASDETFRRFASIEMLRERSRGEAQSVSLYVPHRYLGYYPAPGYRNGRNYHDPKGFRGGVGAVPKPPGEFRIVCLGGSTTYSNYVEAPAEAYPAQLEAELRRRTHADIRVVNAGGQRLGEPRVVDQLRDARARSRPRPRHRLRQRRRHRGPHGVAARGVPRRQLGSAAAFSRTRCAKPWPEQLTLVRMFLIASGRIRSHLDLAESLGNLAATQYYFHFVRQKSDGSYPSGPFRKVSAAQILAANPPVFFRRNLESLVAIARAHGVTPVLVTFAWTEKAAFDPVLTSPEAVAAIKEQNEVVRAIGREQHVAVYDFAAEMPDDPSLYVGAVHMTVEGSRVQARLLADFLLQGRLVPTGE